MSHRSASSHVPAFLLVGALALALPVPIAAQAPRYTITNVSDAVPGQTVGTAGLSDTGFVTGWVVVNAAPFPSTSFRWSSAGTHVPGPPDGVAWLTHAGFDVNDAGTVVGIFGALSPNSMNRGFRAQGGVTEELLTPSGLPAFPAAINDGGWIVGYGGGPVGAPGGVLWSPDLVPSYAGTLGQAIDINESNVIVGTTIDAAAVSTAWRLADGVMTDLGTLDPADAGSVQPFAINNAGLVVGYSLIGPKQHAFRWTEAEGMTELPGLGFDVFPFDVAAVDVNDAGVVLGYAPNASGQTAVLWSPAGEVVELVRRLPDVGPGTNWPLLAHAMKINDAGQIAALAVHAPSAHQARVVLLTPAALGARLRLTSGGATILEVTGATPGGLVHLAGGADDAADRGYTLLPGCGSLGLALQAPVLLGAVQADGAGRALLHWNLPAALVGSPVRLQAFELAACTVSNVVKPGA